MNKSSLIKTILVIMLGMVLMFSTSVFAADHWICFAGLKSDKIISVVQIVPKSTKMRDFSLPVCYYIKV